MILTDYYRMVRLQEYANNKTPRFDTIASTGEYPRFEQMAAKSRVKRFYCYYNGIPDSFSNRAREQAERAITNTKNISSVFIPNLNKPLFGYGDVKGTQDAILFVFSADYSLMEVFIARGYKPHQKALYASMMRGDLNTEMSRIRQAAINLNR